MTTDLQRLLPPSISGDAGMQAAAKAAGDQEAEVRAQIINAYIWSRLDDLPEAVLDHLCWSLHIDGWQYATTRALKLWLVHNFYEWHIYKGTEYGLALYWSTLLNRDLLKAEPAHKSYLGNSLTEAEREAFEAPHPEIRAYPFRKYGQKQSLFVNDCLGDPVENYSVFPYQTDAILRCGERLELVDPELGTVTPLHDLLYESDQVERLAADIIEVRKPGQAAGLFPGQALRGFLVDHEARKRFYTLRMERAYTDEIERRIPLSIQPSLEPMSVYYSWKHDKGQAGTGIFLANRWPDEYPDTGGRAYPGMAFYPHASDANLRLYKCFKLFDPDRVVFNRREITNFLGAFRLGPLPPHTAEVAVDMAGKLPTLAFSAPGYCNAGHFTISDAATRIAQVRHVGKMAARLSDKVLLSITNRKQIQASTSILAGSAVAGEYRLEVI